MNPNLTAAGLLAAALLAGCATPPSRTDTAFGESVRQARAVQVIDPEASAKGGNPSVGVDARTSRSAIDLYQESFKAPQRAFDVLGIGGLKGGAQ